MWILLALLTAGCTAVRDAASKHATREAHPVVVAFGLALLPAVALGLIVLVRGPVAPREGFLTALLISGAINAVATPLIVWALERSDLSLVAPLTSLTPLFMLGTGAVVLGEEPSAAGAVGVVVIVVGAYLLNVSDRRAGPLAPFLALLRDPGARAMLLVAFLYSISATYDKVGVQASSPLFWAASVQGLVAVALGPLALRRWRRGKRPRPDAGPAVPAPSLFGWVPSPWTAIGLAGAVTAVALAAQNTALTLTLAAYVIAVKRTSTLFGVLIGHSLFREARVAERLLGAAVMLAGFVLLTLGGG